MSHVAPPGTRPHGSPSAARARRLYLEAVHDRSVGAFASNAPGAEMHLHAVGEALVPVVRIPGNEPSAAFFSPSTRLLAYPFFTIGRESGSLVRGACGALSRLSCGILRSLGLDRVAYVNHWIFPNAPRLHVSPRDLSVLLEELIDSHPDHALVFDKLVPAFDAELIDRLSARGAIAIPGSTSWITEPTDGFPGKEGRPIRKTRRADRARSEALSPLHVSRSSVLRGRGEELRRLYAQIYLERHPAHLNIQFTAAFFDLLVESDVCEFVAWADEGKILAFTFFLRDSRCIAGGVFGLDPDLPKSLGLFRALIAAQIQASFEAGLPLDLAGGNDRFKKLRGLRPHQDFMLVLADHLPGPKRAGWRALAATRTAWRARRGV